ncbi:Sec20-domain-containing protein [Ramaria rubella]|nr:Sec20-domain-containing protein [Ramaria rubella]
MPPLHSTLQVETANLVDLLTRRQKDIQEFQISRLRDFTGSLATQQQHAAELREDLETFARNVKALTSLAEDQERERERREVAHRAQQFAASLDQMRKDTRVALLTSKRAIDSLTLSNKEELLQSGMFEKASDEKSGDALINTSNDVTEALRRTIGLMQGELERSVLSSQMLEQSSANLRSTTAVHDTLTTLLSTSKHLITALEKSDWLDRLLILAAVAFFFLVVIFILKQRVMDKGLRIAFWWTRFLPNFREDAELLKADSVGLSAVVIGTATSALSTTLSFAGMGPISSFPEHSQVVDAVLLTPSPSPASNTHDLEKPIQELLLTTKLPSTMLQNNEPRPHQEL